MTGLPTRELRVCVLTPSFPPTLGGQEKHLLELCAGLIGCGATVQVLTRRVTPTVPARETLGVVPVRRLTPFGAIKGVGLIAAPRLGILLGRMIWRLLRDRRDYDVVLVSGFNFMPMAPVIAAWVTRKPCVVRPESPLEVVEAVGGDSRAKMGLAASSLPLRLLASLRRATARRVDRYVAISSEIRAGLEGQGIDPRRVVAIPNGIDVGRFSAVTADDKTRLRARLGLPSEKLLMIYTGRLAVTKGVMMLIDVWRELASRHPLAHLILVGSGSGSYDGCETELRAFIAEHGLADRVTLTGSVPHVHEYLQASDLFVFPSDYEGFSLSILEAMTAGLPLVSTRVGIAAELENSCRFGLLVPPKDREAFREALDRLLPDAALRAAFGAAGSAAVRAEYSIETEARRYLTLLGGLAT